MKLEVDQKYPIECVPGVRTLIVGSSFLVIYCCDRLTKPTVKRWCEGPIKYAVYVEAYVPWVIFAIGGRTFFFDVALTLVTEPAEKQRAFLEPGNKVLLHLVSEEDSILRGSRKIGINRDAEWFIKTACRDQLAAYHTPRDVHAAICRIQNRLTADQMFQKSAVFQLPGRWRNTP